MKLSLVFILVWSTASVARPCGLCGIHITHRGEETASLFIENVTIIDGLGGEARPNQDIEVIGGRIARIGKDLKSTVTPSLNGSGLFVIPGLIDGHTHLRSVPGAIFRQDSIEELRRQRSMQLRAYLAAGVTTVLDAAAPESLFLENTTRRVGPRVLGLAPFLTPEGGYFGSVEARGNQYDDLWEPVKSDETIGRNFARAAKLHPLGVKVTIEKGFGPFDTWPVFNEDFRKSIASQAESLHLPIFVHSMTEEEHRLALSLKPYAFVHAGFATHEPSSDILNEIKKSHAYVVTTTAIYKMMLLMWHASDLSEAWARLLIPANQINTGLSEDARKWVVAEVVAQSKPSWSPLFFAKLFARFFLNPSLVERQLRSTSAAVKKMYESQIPLVMGSDSGNWPVWTTFYHGVGSILEMEALEDAGIPNNEIIVAATSRAAKMLKIDSDVGSIERGKVADLVILRDNPLDNMKAFRDIHLVVKSGVSKSPQQWTAD